MSHLQPDHAATVHGPRLAHPALDAHRVILLLMLALASVAGSLVPQWPNSPERVMRYQLDHPLVGDFYGRAGLFDVFGSWWFVLITTLLFVSLVACLFPRTRALVRTSARGPSRRARSTRSGSTRSAWCRRIPIRRSTAHSRCCAAGFPRGARRAIARRSRRRKARSARSGSLLFHWAFLLILIGVIYGKGTGFTGRAVVIEGQTWIDAQANYDGRPATGRFFDGDFTGIGIHLRGFEDTYRQTG